MLNTFKAFFSKTTELDTHGNVQTRRAFSLRALPIHFHW